MPEYIVKQFVVDKDNPLGTFVVQPVESKTQHLMEVSGDLLGTIYWDYELLDYVIECDERYVFNPWSPSR